jgi:hypothetical protein
MVWDHLLRRGGVEFGLASSELALFGVGGGQGDGLVDREQRFSCEAGAGQ